MKFLEPEEFQRTITKHILQTLKIVMFKVKYLGLAVFQCNGITLHYTLTRKVSQV